MKLLRHPEMTSTISSRFQACLCWWQRSDNTELRTQRSHKWAVLPSQEREEGVVFRRRASETSLFGVSCSVYGPEHAWKRYQMQESFYLEKRKTQNLKVPFLSSELAHTLSVECFSLNKSTSHLSLCLSLNSFCKETSRT